MTTYVLIPGAGGEAAYWSLVAERLRASGDVAISPDLPADDPSAHLSDYADVVVAAANGGGDGTVVVGQSLGASARRWSPSACGRAGSTSSAP